jgi:hypothetical protein
LRLLVVLASRRDMPAAKKAFCISKLPLKAASIPCA